MQSNLLQLHELVDILVHKKWYVFISKDGKEKLVG